MSYRTTTPIILALLTACGPAPVDCPDCFESETGAETAGDTGDTTGVAVPDLGGDGDSGEPGDGDGDGDGDGVVDIELCDAAEHIELAEVECTTDGCAGRWQGTNLWSTVFSSVEILGLDTVDASALWTCDQTPTVDLCVEVDTNGHIGCFWIMDGWAVPVAPCCSAATTWLAIGEGMAAAAGH